MRHKVIGLPGQVSRRLVVLTVHRESRVPQVTPEDRCHAHIMRYFEGSADLGNMAFRRWRTEIDGGAYGYRTEVETLFNTGEQDLIPFIGIAQQFVVVDFHNKRDVVSV